MSEEDRLMTHEYDGIREYDNPLPGWWKWIFVATIIFSPIYAWYYHFGGPGKSIHQEFAADWKEYEAWKTRAQLATDIVVTEDSLKVLAHDGQVVAAGREIFTKNCVACHLDNGRGQIGANLTDDYQIHGTGRLDLYNTIKDGVADKGMIAWGQTMQPREMATVCAYVSTLRNTNVADGKPPQGEKVERFPE